MFFYCLFSFNGVFFFFSLSLSLSLFWWAYPDCEDITFGVSWKVMPLCCWIDLYLSAICPMRLLKQTLSTNGVNLIEVEGTNNISVPVDTLPALVYNLCSFALNSALILIWCSFLYSQRPFRPFN